MSQTLQCVIKANGFSGLFKRRMFAWMQMAAHLNNTMPHIFIHHSSCAAGKWCSLYFPFGKTRLRDGGGRGHPFLR